MKKMWTFCDFREKHHRAEQVSDIFLIGKSQNCGPFQEQGESIDPQTLPFPMDLGGGIDPQMDAGVPRDVERAVGAGAK